MVIAFVVIVLCAWSFPGSPEGPDGRHFPGCSPWACIYFCILSPLLFHYVFGFICMNSCMHVVMLENVHKNGKACLQDKGLLMRIEFRYKADVNYL